MSRRSRFMDKFKSKTAKTLDVSSSTDEEHVSTVRCTAQGDLTEHDLQIGRNGLRINGEATRLEMKMEDLEDLQTILGSGASSVVRKMKHIPSGRFIAMKVISLNVSEEVRNAYFRELRTYHTSSHPSIISFYSANYEEGNIYIFLEYMDGSLANVVKKGPIPENVLAKLTLQIVQGLIYLHKELHVVHRDIKPENILVNKQGQVKIADFGVSSQLKNTLGLAETFTGTVTYMDPGRINGQLHSSNSDIWSLGLTIMECALGYYPYHPPSIESDMGQFFDYHAAIVGKDPPILPPDRFSKEFCDFITACLNKNATKRPFAIELQDHPFIKRAEKDESVDLIAWANQVLT